MHVHVSPPDGEAKFWIATELSASVVVGLSPRQVAAAEDIVRRHQRDIVDQDAGRLSARVAGTAGRVV